MADRFTSEVLALIGRDLLYRRLTKTVIVTSPGAGQPVSVKVPGGVIWELQSVFALFTTSAVVANRVVNVNYSDADSVPNARFFSNRQQAAGAANVNYTFAQLGDHVANSGTTDSLPNPAIPLTSGEQIQISAALLDVGDSFTGVVIRVREWDETAIIQEAQEMFTGYQQYIESGYREGSDT